MRIAQIAPLYESVPPRLYGGTERVVAHLADALTDLGHDVTLFASGDSRSRAKLVPAREQALRLDPEGACDLPAHLAMLEEVLAHADDFDVLHFHTDCMQMPVFRHMATRTVTTLHGRLDLKDLAPFYARFMSFPLVSISDHQREPLRFANFVGTVHHGLPADLLTFTAEPAGGYLAFLGRISPEKRPDRAIEIATRAGLPLKIAAKIDRADEAYFRESIAPLLTHPLVDFIGEIGDADKAAFLGGARALLFPIDWPEPFGLVMIEAMACGTPVVAFRCGSVPEVVDDGVTGFIVDDVDGAIQAVRQLDELDRRRVRATFEVRFSAEAMAHSYLRLYERLLAEHEKSLSADPHELRPQPTPVAPAETPSAMVAADALFRSGRGRRPA
ncbi:MAG: glycosyltransferase family 4 protein [Alphaproteobacteria bacterium]